MQLTPPHDPVRALRNAEYSPSFALVSHTIVAARQDGHVAVDFEAEPSFANQNGVVMGGAATVMLDILLAYSGFARTGLWLPTVEIKSSFLAPLLIAPSRGEGAILKAGRNLVFAEATLFRADDRMAVHATATLVVPKSG